MEKYNVISLGFFCSVAEELERNGFRSMSMPFDWLISDFIGVNQLVSNHFESFLDYDLLSQNELNRNYYRNDQYNVQFFHDFNKYDSLSNQLENVSIKYKKRIDNFYDAIKNPTILIRYIEDNKELAYIESNIGQIESLYKKFNPQNELLFIANRELKSDVLNVFYVDKDENDTVARKPFEQLPDLVTYLESKYDNELREKNIKFYQSKIKKQITLFDKIKNRIKPIYKHDKVYK